jgi:N-acetylneuraminic acid mutarotase
MQKVITLILVLVFFAATYAVLLTPKSIFLIKTAIAQEIVPTQAFVSFSPNPAANNIDPVLLTIRVEPPPPTPSDKYHLIYFPITRPDGTVIDMQYTNTQGSYSGKIYLSSTGNYTVRVSFPGQTFANGTIYYLPCETQTTFTRLPPPPPPWSNEGSWTTKAPMHQARSDLGVAVVNSKIYAIGGTTASGFLPSMPGSMILGLSDIGGIVGTNEEYDPATNIWKYKASMPTPRIMFATAVYQNKIYCIGGKTSEGYTSVNEVYDPATDTWETKAPMPEAIGWLTANVVNDKIYLFDYSGKNFLFDPATDSWTIKTPAPSPAFDGYASAVFGKKIYVIGGLSEDQHYNLNQIYDVETDSWSYGARPPSSHGGGSAGVTTGEMALIRIYVFGTRANLIQGEEKTFVRIYNPKTDSWGFGADTPVKRYNFGVAVLNDTFYAIGGHTYSFPGDYAPVALNEQYVPISYGTPDPSYVPPDVTPPEIAVLSPENVTYYTVDVALNFTVNESVSSMSYALDGENFVEISGNTTLIGLPYGSHNLTVYATDVAGNIGTSETINFTIAEEPKPFPVAPIAVASVATVAVVGVGLLVYFKKRKR